MVNDAVMTTPRATPAGPQGQSEVHVALDGVAKVFAGRDGGQAVHALGPVSFELRKGEFFSVVGPSGCGKSTLLDVIAGLTEPTEGDIRFEGRPVSGEVPEGVAVVFQEDASFPWLNVFDNAAFGGRQMGIGEAEVCARVDYALGFMGLTDFARAYPAQLSGGMRQRVCIARAMVQRPRLMLLDEPFGALDQQTRLLMGEETLKLWRVTGSTIMLITHSIDEAVLLSDRIGVMSARPGCFLDILETGWHRDRGSETALDPRYGQLQSEIWGRLREESLKALGAAR